MSTVDVLDLVISHLTRVRRSGDGVTARCPAHDDRKPSLSVRPGTDRAVVLSCFAGCSAEAIVSALGLDPKEILTARRNGAPSVSGHGGRPARSGQQGHTVADLAREKGLPERVLRGIGLQDAIGRRAVEVPYRDRDGTTLFVRTRESKGGKSKTVQPTGVRLAPYGLDRLHAWKTAERPILVEGESDCWTAWHHWTAALGLPGANTGGCLEFDHVEDVPRIFLVQEPDQGGPTFYTSTQRQLDALGWVGELYAFPLVLDGRRIKDLSDLHLAVGGDHQAFREALDASLDQAMPVDLSDGTLTAWDDGRQDWPEDARARIAELEGRVAELERRPVVGSDGASTCDGSCPTAQRLRDQIHEYKTSDELVRRGPFTPDGALVVKYLVTVAQATRQNGKEKQPLERSEVARLALGKAGQTAEKAVSRALKAYKAYQDDLEIASTLPYRLEWREGGQKTHIDLYPIVTAEPQTKAQEYLALSRLPRDRKPPAKVLDRDDSCRRCHSPKGVEARGVRRCLNEECGHTWHTRPVILGRTEAGPSEAPLASIPTLVPVLPGQNVPAKSGSTYAEQNVPASSPISFVSHSDLEAAAGPHYQTLEVVTEGPPELVPPTPMSWRCPECRALERTILPDGSWRCQGWGHMGRDGPNLLTVSP